MFRSALVEQILKRISLDIRQLSEGVEHTDIPVKTLLQVPPLARMCPGGELRVSIIAISRNCLLQALRLADIVRKTARDHDLKQSAYHPRGLSYRTDTIFSDAYHSPPLVAVYLHRSTEYIIAVLAALASG